MVETTVPATRASFMRTRPHPQSDGIYDADDCVIDGTNFTVMQSRLTSGDDVH